MLAVILLKQIAVMALLTAMGLCLCRLGMLSGKTTKELGAVLVKAVIPCVIFKAFVVVPYSPETARNLMVAVVYVLLVFAVSLGIPYLVYGTRDVISNLGAAFGNAGFIGVPLVQSVAGDTGVFYLAVMMAFLNLFQWTYGINLLTGEKSGFSLKKFFFNPMMISLLLGMLFFFLRIPVSEIFMTTLNSIGGIFTPIAMILLGSYMAELGLKEMFNVKAVLCSLIRLLLIPAVTILMTMVLPKAFRGVYMPLLLASITPIGVNISIYAQQYDRDYRYSVILVCVSTILSVATVPVMYSLADMLI